jgi:D-alanyl-D-alanine carboxypeptidase
VNAPPGETWFYSNTNTVILGRIIEDLTGNSLEHELRTRIFEPYNLVQTTFPVQGNEMPDPHPKAYFTGSPGMAVDWSEAYDISAAWAAGAVISTLADLRVYASLLVDGELTSAESHTFRLNHKVPTNVDEAYYGPGILSWKSFYGHLGGLPGFTSLLLRDSEKDATMIILYNCQLDKYQPAELAERFWHEIFVKDILSLNP